MNNYWIAAGLILNSAVILINRYVWKIPHWLYLLCMILGIVFLLVGAFCAR